MLNKFQYVLINAGIAFKLCRKTNLLPFKEQ